VKGNGVGEPISNFTPARPTSVKSLAGDFVYGYDEANPALLTKMTGPAHSVETSYEPHRNLVTGVVNRVLIQSAARRTDEDTKGKVVSSYTYSNDLLGRRETISQGGEAFGMLKLGHNQVEVAYNDRSEVVGAVYRSGDEARQTFDYAYDAIGNRRTAVSSRVTGQESREEKVSYETNALNQYTAIDERSSSNPKSEIGNPKFDPDGNLLEDARNTYTWNADNTLIRVDAKDGSLRLDYVYDHQSRRTVRIETKQPGTKNEEQRTTYYLYEAWNLLAEIDAVPAGGELGTLNFEPAALFSWGRDLSGSLQGAGGVGGLLAISKVSRGADERGEAQLKTLNLKLETLFPTYDANGNVGQLIDADGTVVAAYAYDPFGNVTEMAGAEASENPWRFSTKPVEEGTGWLYYGYRWYDAGMGRWPSRDPIGERGGINLYALVRNRPTNRVDFLGLACIKEIIVIFDRADAPQLFHTDENGRPDRNRPVELNGRISFGTLCAYGLDGKEIQCWLVTSGGSRASDSAVFKGHDTAVPSGDYNVETKKSGGTQGYLVRNTGLRSLIKIHGTSGVGSDGCIVFPGIGELDTHMTDTREKSKKDVVPISIRHYLANGEDPPTGNQGAGIDDPVRDLPGVDFPDTMGPPGSGSYPYP